MYGWLYLYEIPCVLSVVYFTCYLPNLPKLQQGSLGIVRVRFEANANANANAPCGPSTEPNLFPWNVAPISFSFSFTVDRVGSTESTVQDVQLLQQGEVGTH